MKQRLIWPVLALAVLLSACGADGKAYTTADAQALIDAGAFDGDVYKRQRGSSQGGDERTASERSTIS